MSPPRCRLCMPSSYWSTSRTLLTRTSAPYQTTLSDSMSLAGIGWPWVLERLLSGSRPISGRVRSLSRPFATCACVVIPRKLRQHWWVHSRELGECRGLVTSITFDMFTRADRASLPIVYSSSTWLLSSFMRFSPSPTVRESQSSFQSQLLGIFLAVLCPKATAYQLVPWRQLWCARTGFRGLHLDGHCSECIVLFSASPFSSLS